MEAKRRSLVAITLSSLLVLAFAGTASAQPRQEGLINVNVSDVVIQAPIAIAANICDANVNVLAQQLRFGDTDCTAVANSAGVVEWKGPGGGAQQRGLVNVNVSDVVVQLPIAVAANVCDLNVNVLSVQVAAGNTTCDAQADSSGFIDWHG